MTHKIAALYVPSDPSITTDLWTFDIKDTITTIYEAVGEPFDPLELPGADCQMCVNRYGTMTGLPFNERATAIAIGLQCPALTSFLRGDVLITGGTDALGIINTLDTEKSSAVIRAMYGV